MLLSLSKSDVAFWLGASEWGLLIFGMVLVVGLIGEHKGIKSPKWKASEHIFSMLVILGVAGELVADAGIFIFSGHLQTVSDRENARLILEAGQVRREAEELRMKNNVLELKQSWRVQRMDSVKLAKELEGKPKMRVEVLYQDGDSESYLFSERIVFGLKMANWKVVGLRPIRQDDVPPDSWKYRDIDAPLTVKLGAGGATGFVAKQLPPDFEISLFLMETNNPFGALNLALGMSGGDTGMVAMQDSRLPDDLLKLVIGQKFLIKQSVR